MLQCASVIFLLINLWLEKRGLIAVNYFMDVETIGLAVFSNGLMRYPFLLSIKYIALFRTAETSHVVNLIQAGVRVDHPQEVVVLDELRLVVIVARLGIRNVGAKGSKQSCFLLYYITASFSSHSLAAKEQIHIM